MAAPRARLAGAAVVALLVTGCGPTGAGGDPEPGTPTPSGSSNPSASSGAGASPGSEKRGGSTPVNDQSVPAPSGGAPAVAPALRPQRITVPSIGVDASVIDLGIRDDGAIEVPSDAQRTGWLTSTPAPGQQGPAVVVGHVDSTTGPAVFYELSGLQPGDPITFTRRDGSTVDFTVDGVETYPQDDFPTATVYGPVPGPALRLITCGGDYLRDRGGYQDNVVVYAS